MHGNEMRVREALIAFLEKMLETDISFFSNKKIWLSSLASILGILRPFGFFIVPSPANKFFLSLFFFCVSILSMRYVRNDGNKRVSAGQQGQAVYQKGGGIKDVCRLACRPVVDIQ